MARHPEISVNELPILIDKLDKTGYKSVLLLFGTKMSDYWIKAARTLNTSQSIKYMFAMRPYAISPEYCYMMSKSFNEIQSNRLMINLVSGEFYPEEINPTDPDGIDLDIDDKEKRRLYVRKFAKKYKECFKNNEEVPELLISGAAPTAVRTAKDYGDYGLIMYKDFLFKPSTFDDITKKMINFSVLIRETSEEAEALAKTLNPIDKMNTIYGTKEYVKYRIEDLKYRGINDILIDRAHCEQEADYLHDFVRELIDANI
jgi:hypothetical protein